MQQILKEADFQKRVLWLNGALPGIFLLFDWATGNLGANPPEAILRTTGVVALVFLGLALLVTPVAKILSWGWLVKHRRWLGLWSFYYGLFHLVAYSIFDQNLNTAAIFADIKKRPFILLGFSAFLLLIPLAVTSTNKMIQRLGGKKWKLLHRLTYLIAILAVAHFWLIVKSDLFYPITAALLLGGLLGYRAYQSLMKPKN